MTTSSNPSEWDAIVPASRGVSHRSTTSSRHPGRTFEGSVNYEVRRITQCPDCGFMRLAGLGPHAPRLNARRELVDCAGRPVGAEHRARRTEPANLPVGSEAAEVPSSGRSPRRAPSPEPSTVPEVHPRTPPATDPELGRVSERIGAAIVAFCRAHLGQEFHADELRQHVRGAVGEVAPDSASRILRDLRQQQVVGYELVSRPKSLYRVTSVVGSP